MFTGRERIIKSTWHFVYLLCFFSYWVSGTTSSLKVGVFLFHQIQGWVTMPCSYGKLLFVQFFFPEILFQVLILVFDIKLLPHYTIITLLRMLTISMLHWKVPIGQSLLQADAYNAMQMFACCQLRVVRSFSTLHLDCMPPKLFVFLFRSLRLF